MNKERKPGDSYYPTMNAKSDLFWQIRYLAKQSDCDQLRQQATEPTDDRGPGITLDGEYHENMIVRIYPEKRDRIVKTIRQNLKDGGSYRLTTEEWEHLADLVDTYLAIGPGYYVSERNWERVKEVMNRHRDFYNIQPFRIRL